MSGDRTYGLEVETEYGSAARRDLIGSVESAPAGNVVLRIGKENTPRGKGWHQVAHVVLTPEEAVELAAGLIETSPKREETRAAIRRVFCWVFE